MTCLNSCMRVTRWPSVLGIVTMAATLLGLGCAVQSGGGVRDSSAATTNEGVVIAPLVDHHQHLLSPMAVDLLYRAAGIIEEAVSSEDLTLLLDQAGIERAVVMSNAYYFDSRYSDLQDPYPYVSAENDWTARQVALFPNRLFAFCSFNPLASYAEAELQRCAATAGFAGLKLHFDSSGVDLMNSEHIRQVRNIFESANHLGLAIAVHLQAEPDYGADYVTAFLRQILPAAPDVTVQVAHLWGGGDYSLGALNTFTEALATDKELTRNLYFDLAEVVRVAGGNDEVLHTVAERVRQMGLHRMLYGSDGPYFGNVFPREAWNALQAEMPLSDAEVRTLSTNVAPYLGGTVSTR